MHEWFLPAVGTAIATDARITLPRIHEWFLPAVGRAFATNARISLPLMHEFFCLRWARLLTRISFATDALIFFACGGDGY
jgi:hypothetical protein